MIGKTEINIKIILKILGFLLIVEGIFMLTSLPFSLYYREGQHIAILLSSLITSGTGLGIYLLMGRREKNTVNKREGFVIVTMTWVMISFFGTLPYLFSGTIPSFTNAFFETISGFTTTGASILTDIEAMPRSILFWRSMTHWIGGMGIIVLTVAILPFLGIGGMQLYSAEMPGVTKDKLHPRITETAKRLWGIYILFTLIETALLMFGGMDLFDGLCHSFGTMATGGFSTRNSSIAEFSPYIQYVIILFMFMAGTNFTLHYLLLQGKVKGMFKYDEFKTYLFTILGFSFILGILLVTQAGFGTEKGIRDALFQVVSITTTTGYVTSDYLVWPGYTWFLIFLLMFVGGMAGSTGGGIKVTRHVLMFKNARQELKRTIHPQAIIPVRLNKQAVSQEIIFKVMAFFQIYVLTLVAGAVVMVFLGLDFQTAIGASVATVGNIGPGLGGVGPVENYAFIPSFGKWVLSFLMLLGRLELFTVLILLSPSFWRR
jgi:trk system potassium uptake protein TrkH